MLNVQIITLFPELFAPLLQHGILRRAQQQEQLGVSYYNPRDYTEDKHRQVDDRPYGGGPGMVMMAEPLSRCIEDIKRRSDCGPVIYLSPQGMPLTQHKVVSLSAHHSMTLLCGRYEGIDERVIETYVDEEISIGDYVLSGGEYAAMVLVDAVTRTLPGVLGNEQSPLEDSFSQGLLDWPHYTRPEIFADKAVPQVLLSGNHEQIARWRKAQAEKRTRERRPDLWQNAGFSDKK